MNAHMNSNSASLQAGSSTDVVAQNTGRMASTTLRTPYQGVLQILKFNWRFYAATLAGVAIAILIAPLLPSLLRISIWLAVVPALFWMTASLLVSHYVYDLFPLYDFSWIDRVLERRPERWINIHSGLDETSTILSATFPDAVGTVVDIFDPRVMTETSIHQARRISHNGIAAIPGRFDQLPFENESFDTAFAIFAAHELRQHDQRVSMFAEVRRILRPGGEFVLLEHSRDLANFLAFGPGFLHFFSPHSWRAVARDAGLTLRSESNMTPFVRRYILRRTI